MPKKVSEIIKGSRRAQASKAAIKASLDRTDDFGPFIISLKVFQAEGGPRAEVAFECIATDGDKIYLDIVYPVVHGKHFPGRMSYKGEDRCPDFHLNRAMAKKIYGAVTNLELEELDD